MIQFQIFWRKYGVRRLADLGVLQDVGDIEELPSMCILHVLDCFDSPDMPLIVPDTTGDLYNTKPERKILVHNLSVQPRVTDVFTERDRDIRVPVGSIVQTLQKFRNVNARTVRFVPQLEAMQPRAGFQAVINHNNLFRSRVMGINRKARLLEHVLKEVINVAALYPQYKHLIPIRLSGALFNKSAFDRTFKSIDRKTLRYPNSPHYLFLAHFLAYVHSSSEASLLEKVPDALMQNLIFVAQYGQKLIFYDPLYLREINGDNNAVLMRLIAHFNMLASNGSIDSEDVIDSVPEAAKADIPEAIPQLGEPPPAVTAEAEKDEEPAEPEYAGPAVPEKIVEHRVISTGKNIAAYEPAPIQVKEEKKVLEQDRDALDAAAKAQVDNIRDSTKAKVARVERLAVAYKTLKLEPDGPTLDELITRPHPATIDDHPIEVIRDQVADPSMLTSRVVKFNSDYLKTMFHPDMARVLTSFNRHGLYLTEIRHEDKIDELNRIRNYTVRYEDVNHQTHTIRFSFPIVDPYGNCWINGVQKFLKKQRVNNPIVKSGPARVSLSTNYNKVLVERVAAVANSFYPYMLNLFRKTEAQLVYGVAQSEVDWPFASVPDDAASKKAYAENKPFDTTLTGEQFDIWNGIDAIYGMCQHGPFRVSAKTVSKTSCTLTVVRADVVHSLPYEFTTLGNKLRSVTVKNASFCFHYNHRLQVLNEEQRQAVIKQEAERHGVYVGTSDGRNHCFMNTKGELQVVDPDSLQTVRTTTLIDEYVLVTGVDANPLTDYVILKILNAVLPLGVVLCYRFGLKYILDYLRVPYRIIGEADMRKRISLPTSSIVIRFKNAKLIIPRTPAVPALIMAGLNAYKLREFDIEEMETKDVYYSLLEQKKMSVNYLKGVDSFFDFFMDPITVDVLRRMGEPIELLDLLIRAVALLVTEDFESASSTKNSRIRSYERFAGVLYNELAQAVATHKYRAIGAKTAISINPMSVYKRIQTDSLMENVNTINPLHDIKMSSMISHVGDGGRSEQTFMIADRKFTLDSVGVISESTVASGNVAVVANTTMDPKFENLRGQSAGVSPDKVTPTQLLSLTSLLFPGATQDDGKRACFISIQASSVVGVNKSDLYNVGTGYERVLAHYTRPPFAYVAEGDGKITRLDEALKMVEVTYKDGRKLCFNYGSTISSNSGGGFYLDQPMEHNGLKLNKHVKQGDVLVYNPQFFQLDPISGQVDYKLGTTANVAFMDIDQTLDDSSVISKTLSEKLRFAPISVREVVVTNQTTIHQCVAIGDHVRNIDPLITFDESAVTDITGSGSAELADLLSKLNRASPKAKFDGEIVKIDSFYKCQISDMVPSLAKIVRAAQKDKNAKAAFAKDTESSYAYMPNQPMTVDRVGIVDLHPETVILRFYIEHEVPVYAGSKIIISSSLKSVCGRVLQDDMYTEDGEHRVDVLMSYRSLLARIVNSPILTGIASAIMTKMNQDLIAILEE